MRCYTAAWPSWAVNTNGQPPTQNKHLLSTYCEQAFKSPQKTCSPTYENQQNQTSVKILTKYRKRTIYNQNALIHFLLNFIMAALAQQEKWFALQNFYFHSFHAIKVTTKDTPQTLWVSPLKTVVILQELNRFTSRQVAEVESSAPKQWKSEVPGPHFSLLFPIYLSTIR